MGNIWIDISWKIILKLAQFIVEKKPDDYPQDCIVDFDFRILDILKMQSEAEKKFIEGFNDVLVSDNF